MIRELTSLCLVGYKHSTWCSVCPDSSCVLSRMCQGKIRDWQLTDPVVRSLLSGNIASDAGNCNWSWFVWAGDLCAPVLCERGHLLIGSRT